MFDFGNANETQRQVIKSTDGPVLIIAGPGTGKTFTLVKRAIYLIEEKKCAPEDILIATFTEKAARELLTRLSNELLEKNINVNVDELYIGTIHSICLRLIKEKLEFTSLKKDYRLVDDFEQKYLVFQHAKEFKELDENNLFFENIGNWSIANKVVYYVNAISEELVDESLLNESSDLEIKELSKIIKLYKQILRDENALDFSSIQSVAYNLLKNNPEVLREYQDKIKYIMIDEYQDTNYVQEQLIMLLGAKNNNICVVGDDDQGLYRFRGATIRNILEFPNKFVNCKKFILNNNYRSEKDIIKFYNNWMQETNGDKYEFEWGKYRYEKVILPAKDNFIQGAPTVLKIGGDGSVDSWMRNTLDLINKLKTSGKLTDYNQIAFLFKSVKQENVVELGRFLEKNNIPVYSPRSNLFFDRDEVKIIIGALMFMFPKYVQKLELHKAYINDELETYYKQCLLLFNDFASKNSPKLLNWCKHRAVDHLQITKNLNYAFSGLMYQMFEFEPFKTILETDIGSGVNDTRSIRNLAKFSELVTKFEFMHNITILTVKIIDKMVDRFFSTYLRFLFEGGIAEYEDDLDYAPKGCVSFMTIHQSKGLEFPIVIVGSLYGVPKNNNDKVISMLEENYYHRKTFEPFDKIKLYDFWRLYYTAFSRAQNLLILTAKEKEGVGADPSKYFKNVYEEIPYYWDQTIDYSKYVFNEVKEINIKQSYAFTSGISVYETCSLQYKFFKELGFVAIRQGHTMYGTLVHETIEDIHKAVLRGEYNKITDENIDKWFNLNYESISRKEHSYLMEPVRLSALQSVKRYVERNKNNFANIRAAEVDISYVEPNFILKGKVDLVKGTGDTVEIIDFKSEKKPDIFEDSESFNRYKKQLEIYAYIIEQRYGLKVSKMHLYYTGTENSSPIITFDNKKSDIDESIKEVSTIVNKIENHEYDSGTTKYNTCRNCDFRYFCGRMI